MKTRYGSHTPYKPEFRTHPTQDRFRTTDATHAHTPSLRYVLHNHAHQFTHSFWQFSLSYSSHRKTPSLVIHHTGMSSLADSFVTVFRIFSSSVLLDRLDPSGSRGFWLLIRPQVPPVGFPLAFPTTPYHHHMSWFELIVHPRALVVHQVSSTHHPYPVTVV